MNNCTDCGKSLRANEVAYSHAKTAITARNANRQVGRRQSWCSECHAANEFARQQAMNSYANEITQRLAQKMVDSGLAATLAGAIKELES